MKTLRILLLLAVAAVLAIVATDYFGTQRAGSAGGVAEPEEIPRNLDSKASRFKWSQSSSSERKVEIHADTFEQIRDTTLLQLRGVELLIYRGEEENYDRIVCDSARFDGDTLYSENEVTVLLGLVADDPESEARATRIRSTGVTFESKTGIASTERYTEYEFEGGSGHSMGSFYDSVHRYFRMNSEAYVERHSSTAGQPPMIIRAGELTYFELGQRVDLKNGVSLERGGQQLEAAEAVVALEKGAIRKIAATDARGVEQQQTRVVRFETPRLTAWYSPEQILEHINGEGESLMVSENAASVIRAEGRRIDLHYERPAGAEESVLRDTHVRESASVEAKPADAANKDARIRRIGSEILHLKMDSAGENMEFVETLARGRLDLLPLDGGSGDVLEADRIKMFYAAGNRMEKLEANGNVSLERQPRRKSAAPGVKADAPLRTYSGGLAGEFDPASGEMRELRQWGNFRFERGDRSGRSQQARFDLAANSIELTNQAEVWDPASRTSATRLTLDEESGDFTARGAVASAYHEVTAPADSESTSEETAGALFSPAEPVYATAEHMVFSQRSGVLEYHGKARLWQAADRIDADHIHIDRREKRLNAEGNVLSVMVEEADQAGSPAAAKAAGRPTEVRADAMQYGEAARQLEYDGHVELKRGALTVNARELDVWLAPEGSADGRLQKAVATGEVEVVEAAANRDEARRGYGEQARFFPREDKVILTGEPARVRNAGHDTTQGAELTYFLNDDRLLVLGSPQERSYSLRRKREP